MEYIQEFYNETHIPCMVYYICMLYCYTKKLITSNSRKLYFKNMNYCSEEDGVILIGIYNSHNHARFSFNFQSMGIPESISKFRPMWVNLFWKLVVQQCILYTIALIGTGICAWCDALVNGAIYILTLYLYMYTTTIQNIETHLMCIQI